MEGGCFQVVSVLYFECNSNKFELKGFLFSDNVDFSVKDLYAKG